MSAKITVNFPHCLKFITLSDLPTNRTEREAKDA